MQADRLDDVTSDEMLAELKRRHRAMLFLGVDVKDMVQAAYGGRTMEVLGLAAYAQFRIPQLVLHGIDGGQSSSEQ